MAPTNGFQLDDGDFGPRMTLTGPWSPAVADAARSVRPAELYLNYSLGWEGDGLDWLTALPALTAIHILDRDLTDITGLRHVPALRRLRLEVSPRAAIDLRQFSKLQEFSGFWVNSEYSVFGVEHLKRLRLIGYPHPVPQGFGALRDLVGLALYSSRIESLGDIAGISGLQSLCFAHCGRLRDLAGLAMLTELQEFVLESCAEVTSIDAVASLKALRSLIIDDSGVIASLEPLRGLPELRTLRFGGSTSIQDGDLTPVQGLEHLANLGFVQRKHYNVSWRSLPSRLFESRYHLTWS